MFPALRLSSHLIKEAKHEAQHLPHFDFIQSFLTKSKFIFKSSPDSSRLLLLKPVEDYLVEVEFFSRLPLHKTEQFSDMEFEEDGPVKEVISDSSTSTIVFSRQGWKFMAECIHLNSATQFSSLLTTNLDLVSPKQNCEYHLYFNPLNSIYKSCFANLSADIQRSFIRLVESAEIPGELGQFIELTSLWHEHSQYKKWLADLSDFALKA
jgi:hypothetical protein